MSESNDITTPEIWKPIPGFEGAFDASTHGRIRANRRFTFSRWHEEKILHPSVLESGYLKVNLSHRGDIHQRRVHRLILETFVGPCPDGMECRHGDGNRKNNNLSNLSWGSLFHLRPPIVAACGLMPDPVVKLVAMYTIPIRLMDEAKSRGINLLVHSELENGTVDQRAWRKAAAARGLPYIDTYLDDSDADDPNLLGWIIKNSDEWNRVRGNPPVLPDVAPFIAEAKKLAALNAAKGTSKWIMANCDGQAALAALFEKPPYNGVRNGEKSLLPYLTVRSADIYPVVATAADTPEQRARRPMDMPAKVAYRLRTWSDEIAAPTALYAAFVEAQKGWNSPLGVTPDQMREQVAYLTGQKPFPFPNVTGKTILTIQLPVIDILIWWTANGQSGPGWKWIAQTPEQAAAQTEITKALLGTAPAPLPDNPAPPDDRDATIAQLRLDLAAEKIATADAEKRAAVFADTAAVATARVAELQDAIRGRRDAKAAYQAAEAKLETAAK